MPEYKFMIFDNHDNQSTRAARSHAMRTALQLRSENPTRAGSSAYSTSNLTTKLQAELKGRFRIPTKNTKRISQIRGGILKSKNDTDYDDYEEEEEEIINDTSIPQGTSSMNPRCTQINAFANNTVDPFDILPVAGTGTVDLLTKYFLCGLKLNITTVNPKNTWIEFALSDRILFHATLAFAASAWNVNVDNPFSWLSYACYHHKGLTMRMINERLKNHPYTASDAVTGAVATLVNIETLAGNFSAADAHLMGLLSIVKARGGIETFKENFIVERAITWVDINLAVYYGRQPLFPPIHDSNDVYLPHNLVTLSNHAAVGDLITPGPGALDLLYILRLLRLIVIVRNETSKKPGMQNTMRVLLLRADRCILKLLMMSKQNSSVSNLVRTANSASHVLLHRVLRNAPKNSPVFHKLLERLRLNLDHGNVEEFGSVGPFITLLWVLIVGVAATYDLPEQNTWFLARLTAAFSTFNRRHEMNRSQLEQRLNSFVWLKTMCEPVLDGLWNSGRYHYILEKSL